MTMFQLLPAPSASTDRTTLLPALRAGIVANGSSSRITRRKFGFGRVRISDWGYRQFRVY
jgi:hypothetical protein